MVQKGARKNLDLTGPFVPRGMLETIRGKGKCTADVPFRWDVERPQYGGERVGLGRFRSDKFFQPFRIALEQPQQLSHWTTDKYLTQFVFLK